MSSTHLADIPIYRVADLDVPGGTVWSMARDPAESLRDSVTHTSVTDTNKNANLQLHGFVSRAEADAFVCGLVAVQSNDAPDWSFRVISSRLFVILIDLHDTTMHQITRKMHTTEDETVAFMESEPASGYDHMFAVSFNLKTPRSGTSDDYPTRHEMMASLQKRAQELFDNNEFEEACGLPFDTLAIEDT